MVAKDPEGKKAIVPPLILEDPEEIRRFASALRRKRLRHYITERMEEYKSSFIVDKDTRTFLADERCVIRLADE